MLNQLTTTKMMIPHSREEAPAYKPYKDRIFKKRLDKLKRLFDSVDETSLKGSDKKKLKNRMKIEVSEMKF